MNSEIPLSEENPSEASLEPRDSRPEIYPGEVFANVADFDTGIRQLLPIYDDLLAALLRCIPITSKHILELGCGTGELSLKLLAHCPEAELVAVDYSPRMLNRCQDKIEAAGYGERVRWIEADFGNLASLNVRIAPHQGFDVCASSLAIHHLSDPVKLKLFKWVRQNLSPGGCFWNADPVLSETSALEAIYQAVREEGVKAQGISLENVRAKCGKSIPQGYSGPDRLATVLEQVDLLKSADFATVAIPWKHYGLAVFGGSCGGI
ncbi:class I SAM-dependent methyltransferase [Laspinema sp. A4]|uniref:class I SAM-dependent methyltransferase n=1 Tax=Laspinema sp. D2d TaxID=2953686 RepID=UPI0021BABDCA|nr:class I SAM-dependent methyltransferase [Laspinema sp. D2d]MCT7982254.1 class I SAM-dependent methyltransferase [Laspinema sp. D2d]